MIPFFAKDASVDYENMFLDEKRKQEIVRIMIQSLENLGYDLSANQLIEESGFNLEKEKSLKLRQSILMAQWQKALDLLTEIGLKEAELQESKYLIYKEKYLELLEMRKITEAVAVLRSDLALLSTDTSELHKLASLLMCNSSDEIREKYDWGGANLRSRKKLLSKIQNSCESLSMLEANKMEKIIKQAISYQVVDCKYHSKLSKNFSLLEEHRCDCDSYPKKCVATLRDHSDEVWLVKFSNNGSYIVSVAKNSVMIMWSFNLKTFKTHLKYKKNDIHNKEVHSINFSPNDKEILTASSDQTIKIWRAENGDLLTTLKGHKQIVHVAIWSRSGKAIYSGGVDNFILCWNHRGDQTASINSNKILDLMISNDEKHLFAVCASYHLINIIDVNQKKEIKSIKEKEAIVSAALSKDDKFLLINTSYKNPELHLWSLENFELVNRYESHRQEKFMIRCAFGGNADHLVGCGSEDHKIHIWHRNVNNPLAILEGHELTVNSISWNNEFGEILASASDDCTVKIWASETIAQAMEESKNEMNVETPKKGKEKIKEESGLILGGGEPGSFEEECN